MAKLVAVTMADIGRSIGLSQASVSLALRNHKSIPASTRERVRLAAERLGYRQHAGISSLMARIRSRRPKLYRSKLAAITNWTDGISPALSRTPFLQWQGARERALELGYDLEPFAVGQAAGDDRRITRILTTRNIEGVVIFPLNNISTVKLPWDSLASVTLEYAFNNPPLHRVVTSHYDSMIMALEQLRLRGYKKIGLVQDEVLIGRVRQRWLAAFYVFGFNTAHIYPDAILTINEANAERLLSSWLRKFQPDAVIYGGIGHIRKWLNKLSYPAPEKIGLVSLSDYRPEEDCARIDEGWSRVGAAAVDAVIGQLYRGERGVPAFPLSYLVRGEWIEGTSIRPLQDR